MFKRLQQQAIDLAKVAWRAAVAGGGLAALYLCTSTLLAAILVGGYLVFAWNVDKERWNRAFAILRGIELAEIHQAEQEAAAEIHHQSVLETRAMRTREDEFLRDIRMPVFELPPVPEIPVPEPPSGPSAEELLSRQRDAAQARARAAGLAEQTDLIANMVADDAKEVIRRIWRDDDHRALQILMGMDERPRQRILSAMQVTADEELRDLVEILQRIGDGEPMLSELGGAPM